MATDSANDKCDKATFETVLDKELGQIDERRKLLELTDQQAEHPTEPALARARRRRLVGLAFSGGGIRSATFNLGLLQGLASLGLFKFVDFLSTVSGGGYIGSWLAAWVRRRPGGVREVERQLAGDRSKAAPTQPSPDAGGGQGGGDEPPPLQHLRRYSNYLAPRTGFLSADTWVLWASYLRNFVLNQLVLLPAVAGVLLLSRVVMLFYFPLPGWRTPPVGYFIGVVAVFSALWLTAFALIVRGAMQVRHRTHDPAQRAAADGRMRPVVMAGITILLVVASVVFCCIVPYTLPIGEPREASELVHPNTSRTWLQLGVFAVAGAMLVVIGYLIALFTRSGPRPQALGERLAFTAAAGLLGGALLYLTYFILHDFFDGDSMGARDYVQVRATAQLTTFGPPVVLAVMVLAISIGVGFLKRRFGEELREWWSSLCGRLLVAAVVWMSVNLVALYGTAVVLLAGPWVQAALGSSWLLAVVAGLFAGKDARTGSPRGQSAGALDRLARLAPHVFLLGLLILVSLLIHVTLDNPPNWRAAADSVWARRISPEQPATEVTTITTKRPQEPPGEPSRLDVIRREERIDVGEIVQQMYWVGMLNTDPHHVPYERYRLSSWDLARLQRDRVPEEILIKLTAPLVSDKADDALGRSEFFNELDKRLPADTSYAHRLMIIHLAKDTHSMALDRTYRLWTLLGALGLCIGLGLLAAWRVDVNLFSLHALYGNRLVRAYLGASRPRAQTARALVLQRDPDPVTELDPNDDMCLADLSINRGDYDGPYLIVNTAMNLVRGDRLDWQERKAESFVLTPLFCGSEGTAYRPTECPPSGYAGGLTLGTAVTISGAAASPNMGYHSTLSVTALLTVFNARLGAWLGNPASPTRWNRPGPQCGFVYMLRELFGLTRASGGYVYLSDGGHFENLGVYELVRRRCQYIIASDAGCDPDHIFDDLGNLIRKVRTDFGVRIEIDLGALRRSPEQRYSRWHCAVGKVRYDDVDPNASPGTLIYFKPSLTGDEPADVLQYADRFADFPHQATADQFFNESQFESYRALGQHVAEAVFGPSVADMEKEIEQEQTDPGDLHRQRCRSLFASVVRRWFAMPPEYESTFQHSTEAFVEIQKALRTDMRLWRLSHDLYPELEPLTLSSPPSNAGENKERGRALELDRGEPAEQRAARRAAELHVVLQMLQAMESAWMSLNLDVHYAHPLNRGWMDVFHRWTSAETVRELWPIVRAEFGRGFVSFCEKQMRMGEVIGHAAPMATDEVPPLLCREFIDQWPQDELRLQGRAELARGPDGARVWLVFSRLRHGPEPNTDAVPSGIIMVLPVGDAPTNPPTYELFVWMRGAYRNTGLGRPAVRQVLELLRERWTGRFQLIVRLPPPDRTGSGDKLQRGMWLTFFHHHEFVRQQPLQAAAAEQAARTEEGDENDVVLERVFPDRDEAETAGEKPATRTT